MRKFYAMILTLVFILTAANVAVLENSKTTGYKIAGETESYLELNFDLKEISYADVSTEKGVFTQIGIESGTLTKEAGYPALPAYNRMIAMPFGAEAEVEIISYETKSYNLSDLGITNPIMPAQPSYSKSSKPEDRKFIYNESAYSASKYIESPIASISKSGTMRGIGVGVISVEPIRYNPSSREIQVFNNVKVRVNYTGANPRAAEIAREEYSPFFESAYSKLINYKPLDSKADITTYPVTYLILANSGLNGNADLNRLIAWKKEKGFNVIVNYVTAASTITTNDAWIESQYNSLNPKPSFVLVVGDHDGTYGVLSEVNPPLGSTGSVTRSDLLYGVIGATSSTNKIPSMYVGRFSVRALAELTAQVDKTLWYEKEQFLVATPDLNYLTYTLGVAGVDATYASKFGDPQIYYGWTYYFNAAHGMGNSETYMSSESNASTADLEIRNFMSAGAAFYNYTAHGDITMFYDPNFTNTHVDAMTNANKYPIMVGNCCLTGSFGTTECFGEALLNAPNKGAVGYIGASMSTYWNEDLTMGVGMDVNSQSAPALDVANPGMYDGIMALGYSSTGAMKHVGLMAVDNNNQTFEDDYWSAYHLFGDPSLMPYFGIPGTMTASHDGVIAPGVTTYTVTTTPYAYVAMGDQSGVLHGAARANSSGVAVVPVTPYTVGNTGKLVITAQFKQPYFEDVLCTGATGGDLGLSDTSLNFGYVTVGGNSTLQFTISNDHNSEYLMGDITTITGYSVGEATKNVLNYSVGPNSDKTFDLVFSPVAQTTYSGNIVITSTDTSHPTNNISVSGTGAYPDISLPSSAGATALPGGSITDSFVISNTGTSGLNYSLSNSYVGYQIPGGNYHSNDFQSGLVYTNSGAGSWTASTTGSGTWNGGTICASTQIETTNIMTSGGFDTSTAGGTVYLDFDYTYTHASGASGTIEYYTGSTWASVWTISAAGSGHVQVELPIKSNNTQIRVTGVMTKQQGGVRSYFRVDNFNVTCAAVPYSWLTFDSPTSGLVASSGSNTIDMTYDATGLSEGVYESDITVASDDPDEPSEVIHVTFTVGNDTPPSSPENITVVTATASEVNLGWDAVSGAATYHIYRSTEPYSGFTEIGTSGTNSYQDTDVLTGNKYFYYITAE